MKRDYFFAKLKKRAKIRTVILDKRNKTTTSEIKTTLAETVIEKTRKRFPSFNNCAATIITGRIERIGKAEYEDSNPSWS